MKLDDIYPQRYQQLLARLKEARLQAGLTQAEVGELLGKSQYFVSRSETGERRIDVIELQAFAQVYGKGLGYFLGE